MADHDPRCVLTLPDRRAAELIAAWLTEKGFPAELVVPPMATGSSALTGETEASAAPEFEVWVTKPEHAGPARALLEEQREGVAALREREAQRAARTGTVTAVCEECGKPSDWPAAEMGKTEVCPHCGQYMDVPDPDESWDDVDFGAGEGEDGSEDE